MIGYGLVALAIGLGTIILVYNSYGYGINTKTGDIIQNGLLFVDSRPGGANILIDGQSRGSTTSARLILPAKDYELSLKKDGYRTWQRQFTLSEHTIARYVYPLLIPEKLTAEPLKKYSSPAGLVTQTPDRRRLLVQVSPTATAPAVFEEFNTGEPGQPPRAVIVPAALFTGLAQGVGMLSEVEWSSDNRHLLARRDWAGQSEYVIIDREQPAQSLNLNRLFNTVPTRIVLRNKKIDQVYLYTADGGHLRVGDTDNGSISTPLLSGVLEFKTHGAGLISYVTAAGAEEGRVAARIWDDGRSYQLSQLPAGPRYLLEAAQFQGDWYYIAGSSASDRLNIYKNPLDALKRTLSAKPPPLFGLRIADAGKVAFSANTRFIGAQSAQKFAVFDFETGDNYHYTVEQPLAGLLGWMDGHRWLGVSEEKVFLFDYDGTNRHSLVATGLAAGGFFDRDYERLFTLSGTDLSVTELRTAADRR